jgi:hypothetical protein
MGAWMIPVSERRRKFLSRLCITITPMTLLAAKLRARTQGASPQNSSDPKTNEDNGPTPPFSRKAVLAENEKDIKKKVGKLFQLASELKEEVDKTDSVKVLSLAMLKKAEEIEKLAKDIKTRAKG